MMPASCNAYPFVSKLLNKKRLTYSTLRYYIQI